MKTEQASATAPPSGGREYWTPRRLWRLVWPLVIEQLLTVLLGVVDTTMVAAVGEAAVSGVSLVDNINVLLISVFAAFATGGAVVASQYMGRREPQNASRAARQLVYIVTGLSLVLAALCLALRQVLLTAVFGHIEPAVMQNAQTYFWMSALSYPFIAVYNGGAALFRSMGNSRVSMLTALLMNLLNIGGNSLFIYGMGMGVAGAALSTLISRAVAAVAIILLLLPQRPGGISLSGLFRLWLDREIIRSIVKIGLPGSIESSLFQVGKVMVARIVSTFGTAAIAGNAIANVLGTFVNVGGMAVGMAMITVVGQCVGAGDYAAAKKQTGRLMLATTLFMTAIGLLLFALARPLLGLFGLSAEATGIALKCLRLFCLCAGPLWPPSFGLPNALRAAGDARFTMLVSMFSMWTFRIGFALLFSYVFHWGVFGIWIAMVLDWVGRISFFVPRWLGGKWQKHRVLGRS